MGIIRDILDTVRDVTSMAGNTSVDDAFKKRRYSSLSKRSLEGTLQFPVLVSKSLDIDTLQMVSKALERQYGSFVQVSLTMSPTLNVSTEKDAVGYLRKFHQNSNIKVGLGDLHNLVTDVLESYDGYTDESQELFVFATMTEGSTANIIASNKEQLQGILEGVREDILNNKFVPNNTLYSFKDDNLNAYHNKIVKEAKGPQPTTNIGGNVTSGDTLIDTVQQLVVQGGGAGKKNVIDLPNNILKDNDAKKANELVPMTMHVRTILVNKEGESQGSMDFIIGIKTTMHTVSSDEMVSNMLSAVKNKNNFFNSIRWTSGEISFFKDFVFNIKEIKDDVANRSAGASPWWIALKRRRALAKIKGAVMLPNNVLPNASIVMSMEEVEYIKSEYGYDLMNPMFVNKIMNEYFLLGFTVVDNSTQIAHFLFDGHKDFQSIPFSSLERDAKGSGGVDFKDVLKLVQRV